MSTQSHKTRQNTDLTLDVIEAALLRLEAQGKIVRVLRPDGSPMLDKDGDQLWTIAPKERH